MLQTTRASLACAPLAALAAPLAADTRPSAAATAPVARFSTLAHAAIAD